MVSELDVVEICKHMEEVVSELMVVEIYKHKEVMEETYNGKVVDVICNNKAGICETGSCRNATDGKNP